MLGLSERGCRRGKKTSEPGSVLHSAKKSMLLVFSVLAVRTEVRRAQAGEGLQCRDEADAGFAGKNFGLTSGLDASNSPNNSCSMNTYKRQFHTLP